MLRSVFLAVLTICPAAAVELKDDRDLTLRLPRPATRIVALSPHLVEMVFSAGAGHRLAAVVRFSDYPEAARALPDVGDASRIDLERVIALAPDLVLAWRSGNPAADLSRLERLGLRVFVTEPRRLSDIPRLLRSIGALAGTELHAEKSALAFERELEALRARYSTARPVRVFYEIWHRPLLTVNRAHLISDVISLCGGVNVFAGAPLLTPSVTLEAVLAGKPQVVLGGSSSMRAEELAAAWRGAPVRALRGLPVRFVPPDLIQRQTPRIAEGARFVCEYLEEVRKNAKR